MIQIEDPSLQGGFSQVYQIEKPFIVTTHNKNHFQDHIMVRVFENKSGFKVQLTSESNISFLYVLEITQANISQIRKQNSLNIDLKDFSEWFTACLEGWRHQKSPSHSRSRRVQQQQQERESIELNLLIRSKTQAVLKISKQQQYKTYQIARLSFMAAAQNQAKENLMYRYQKMKIRKRMLDEYLHSVEGIIKTKNPALLLEFSNLNKKKMPFK